MPPLEVRQAAARYARENPSASPDAAFMQGYLFSQQPCSVTAPDDSPISLICDMSPTEMFEQVWLLYDRKDNKQKALKAWLKLSGQEQQRCLYHAPLFVRANPDKKYRPMLVTYLNQKRFNDEEIIDNGNRTVTTDKRQQRYAEYAEAIEAVGRKG